MPPASPEPGGSCGDVWRLIMATLGGRASFRLVRRSTMSLRSMVVGSLQLQRAGRWDQPGPEMEEPAPEGGSSRLRPVASGYPTLRTAALPASAVEPAAFRTLVAAFWNRLPTASTCWRATLVCSAARFVYTERRMLFTS